MNEQVKRWYKKVWMTRGARFNAFRRYEKLHSISNLSISLLTAYVIILNLFVYIDTDNKVLSDNNITILTIVFSTITLVIGLEISSRNYKTKAIRFHDCGIELANIYNQLSKHFDSNSEVTQDVFDNLIEEYNSIIAKYAFNHSEDDLIKFKIQNESEFEGDGIDFFFKAWFRLKVFFKSELIYYVMMILPPVLLMMILTK